MAEKSTKKQSVAVPSAGKTKNISLDPTRPAPSSHQSSFRQMLEAVYQQINYNFFALLRYQKELADEIAKIITEIYMYNDRVIIEIDGDEIEAGVVKEIYRELREEHICAVINQYSAVRTMVRYPKRYIRTCLYNIVFSLALQEANAEAVAEEEPQ
jgi:hypothetical protein